MFDADLCIKICLYIIQRENLFAIGVVDSLQGEIAIVNGKALISSIKLSPKLLFIFLVIM